MSTARTIAGRFRAACGEMAAADRRQSLRLAAERHRRFVVRLIDLALDECERHALVAGQMAAPPPAMADLVEDLELAAGDPVRRPGTTHETHEALLDLQADYLLPHPAFAPTDGGDLEGVVAVVGQGGDGR